MDNVVDYSAITISLTSLLISFLVHKDSKNNTKNIFLNTLRDNVKKTKYYIFNFREKIYSNDEKLQDIEYCRDLLLYLGYEQEKKNYLTHAQSSLLSKLNESIDDYVSLLLNNIDIIDNKNLAKDELNSLLKIL